MYPHWRRVFYPPTLPLSRWFDYYARRFPTVELNNSFYRLPARRVFEAWRRLRRFLTRLRGLGDALGPTLFQLPGHFTVNVERLDGLLRALDRQPWIPGLRAVLEVRHPSWLVPEVFERLERANVALCLHDWRSAPVEGPVTADFVYLRRHGTGRRYGSSTTAVLRTDVRRVRAWLHHGRDVHVYFNNAGGGAAVRNALTLTALLGRR